MSKVNLKNLSLKELQKLRADVDKQIQARKGQEKAKTLKELHELASKRGYQLDELVGTKKGRSKLPPKYINPDDPSQTWSGRGKRPNWLQEKLKKGAKLESFKI